MAWVKITDYDRAWERWVEHWPCKTACPWITFTGSPFPNTQLHNEDGHFWQVSTEASAELIKLIANSPHYVALLKMMAIKEVEKIF